MVQSILTQIDTSGNMRRIDPHQCATLAFEVRRESAMPEYVFDDPATHNFIRKGIERLREEFRGIFSNATIQRFVDEAIASLLGARIKDNVPPFVNRFARERLLALAGSGSRPVGQGRP
jgi:hypothetical protein